MNKNNNNKSTLDKVSNKASEMRKSSKSTASSGLSHGHNKLNKEK